MISVLLPTYNRPSWLAESIESVLNQECDLELLILDNGSGVETGQVLSRYTDPRIKRFRVEQNGEVPGWGYLAKKVQGEYACFWADDDRMLPGGLKRKLDFLEAHPELGMVFSACEEIDEAGNSKGKAKVGCISEEEVLDIRTASMMTTCYIPNTSCLVRSVYLPLYQDCLQFDPVADWAFWLEVASFGMGCGFIPEETIQLRLHASSGTEDARRQGAFRQAFLKVWEHWLRLGLKLTEDEWQMILMIYASFYVEMGYKNQEAMKEAIQVINHLKELKWEAA